MLLDRIQGISFWERLFGWGKFRKEVLSSAEALANLGNDLKTRHSKEQQLLQQLQEVKNHSLLLKKDLEKLTELKARDEKQWMDRYNENVVQLNSLRDEFIRERNEEREEKKKEEEERMLSLKSSWQNHQDEVQKSIKSLCSKHTIQYLDKVPFRGEPDNALYICNEHVIFDAKSPAGDDLSNFPAYLKDQAERAKKYAKQDAVKSDIFFVVPSSTLSALRQVVYGMGDYNVYIVSTEVPEPLILSLCKIEEYEFAEQLSPEDRENICRILGKFAHLSKRRIQIDSFFAKQFMELAFKCETSLPDEVHDKMLEFERSEKLNPPVEKRAKAIPLSELQKESEKIVREAEAKGINASGDISIALDGVELYK